MATKFYITTAIDYANGEPHLGHAYEKIGADCIARYRRLRGQDVRFVIGMDENAQNVAQAAAARGLEPKPWVDEIAAKFQAAWRALDLSHDDFIRTTQPRHHIAVEELLRRIQAAGHVSEGVYAGYYCIGCEAFKGEKELENGQCPLHPTREIKWVEEPNYFFHLGAFRDRLLELYTQHPEFVQPKTKLNEVRNVVEDWAADHTLSVSRQRLAWGIPWPGDPGHTVYVWFDALINYLAATGFPEAGYEATWPADVHVIGPDIVRFHAAIWPAMLMAAGLAVPRQVLCHGWINTEGARFSKSAGVRLTLQKIIDRHGPDALRYFVLREVPWGSDGDFTWERFDARYAAELADGYGNLVSRVLAMIERYLDGVVPEAPARTSLDRDGDAAVATYRDRMDNHLLHQGADAAWRLVDASNRFVETEAPWTLAKEQRTAELQQVLGALARAILRITMMASPFMPDKTGLVWAAFGQQGRPESAPWRFLEHPQNHGKTAQKLPPLFPKPETGRVSA